MRQSQQHEAGFVSLFSTIFFMLLITVVTIGFVRIMTIEQRQSLDNDLSASAIAAAESGIDDGKRALLAYNSLAANDPVKVQLGNAFSTPACNSLTGSPLIRTALGLDVDGTIAGNTQFNQSYTCLTVTLNSADFVGSAGAGKSQIIPLRSTNPAGFEKIDISWHVVSDAVGQDGDGRPKAYAPGPLLFPLNNVNGIPANSWSALGYPAYLRAQVYGYPNGSFDRGQMLLRNRTALLVPGTSGAGVDEAILSNIDATPGDFGTQKVAPTVAKCDQLVLPPSTTVGGYACKIRLELPVDPTLRGNNNNYFLKLTPQYGQTHFRVSLLHDNAPVDFDGVQPIIDATGRAADTYRRIQTRVVLNNLANFPEYVVESGDTICKNMQVSGDPAFYQPNNCP